ncbi:MAG: cyclase family protein [Elainellaceae cyanobacterium]
MKLSAWFFIALAGVLWFAIATATPSRARPHATIESLTVVDLTQPMPENIPLWPGDPAYEIEPWATYEEDGYFINRVSIGEHSATHWGTPNTFIEGATSAEQVPAQKLVVPAVVMDIREQVQQNEDYRLTLGDVEAWEQAHGPVPAGSVAIILTGWQDRWSDPEAFINADEEGVLHWPGFGTDTAEFLIEQRQIVGLGTDTHGADPGNEENFGASFAMYSADGMILECLGGLDQLPPVGATLVIGGWPIKGGSGSPARVIGLVPR